MEDKENILTYSDLIRVLERKKRENGAEEETIAKNFQGPFCFKTQV